MRKSRLIDEMNNVIDKNNQLYSRCQELENTLNEKIKQVAELTAANAEIVAENELLKAELKNREVAVNATTTTFPVLEMSDVVSLANSENKPELRKQENSDSVIEEEVKQNEDLKPVFASTALIAEEKIKTASQSIGRVVLKCAELCNSFAAIGDINSKDLINLALGRTEVFKSEVLQLATDGKSAEHINDELVSKEKDVLEYFELLKNQI